MIISDAPFTGYLMLQRSTESDAAPDHKGWRGKLVYLMGIMTIEPMMFVQVRIMIMMMIIRMIMIIMTQGLAGGISGIATDQMILYKICRGK